MSLEERVQDLEQRVTALEARQPIPHNTPDTNPFMGRGPVGGPPMPIDDDFQEVFGFWADPLGRRLIAPGSVEESIWLTKYGMYQGVFRSVPAEIEKHLPLLLEHYAMSGIDATPLVVKLGAHQFLAFPGIPGLGYGTPHCFLVGVGNFARDAADGRLDWTIAEIEKRRAK